jgi:hypothetical protein
MVQGAMVRIPLLPVEGLTAPTFCHGLAGFLAVLLHFATDLPNDGWKGAVNEIIESDARSLRTRHDIWHSESGGKAAGHG